MTPATYNIPDHTAGDTWPGIPLISITINSVNPEYPLARAKIQIRKRSSGPVLLEFDSADGGIEIIDSDSWQIKVVGREVDIPAFLYLYDLQTIDSFGNKKTYIKGSWNIVSDITRL